MALFKLSVQVGPNFAPELKPAQEPQFIKISPHWLWMSKPFNHFANRGSRFSWMHTWIQNWAPCWALCSFRPRCTSWWPWRMSSRWRATAEAQPEFWNGNISLVRQKDIESLLGLLYFSFAPLPYNPLSPTRYFLASHFRTDWFSQLGLGNPVGSTTDHL